jgi:hypothetical protein
LLGVGWRKCLWRENIKGFQFFKHMCRFQAI